MYLIQNKTGVPTGLLEPLIEEAAKSVGLQGDFTIKFTQGKRLRGTAWDTSFTRIVLPYSRKNGLSPYWKKHIHEHTALKIYLLIVHELAHIRDYQLNLSDMTHGGPHDKRPCEMRAYMDEQKALYNMVPLLTLPLAKWLAKNA